MRQHQKENHMLSTLKKISVYSFLVLFFCLPIARGQNLNQNGYVAPNPSGAIFIKAGMGINFTGGIGCNSSTPATIIFFQSSTPGTAGSEIGSYNPYTQTGFVWTPQVIGTYYISGY